MADAMVPEPERYSPPPYQPRATLGDYIARVGPQLRATPGRAAATTLVAALIVVCAVALQPVEATGADASGSFKAECGISMYLFGHPSAGVQQTCRDAYTGHAVALFVAGGALLAAVAVLTLLLTRPPTPQSTVATRGWRALVATPGRASAVTAMAVLTLVAVGSLLPARTEGDSPRGAFAAQCGVSIFVFGHTDPAVQHACGDAYGTRGRTFAMSTLAVLVMGAGVTTSVRNERRRDEHPALAEEPIGVDGT